jgi:hypothetical protein
VLKGVQDTDIATVCHATSQQKSFFTEAVFSSGGLKYRKKEIDPPINRANSGM